MNKASLTVFLCSTYSDLSGERLAVLEAVRKLRLQHDSMEFFGARTAQPIETCLDEVRRSDVLVVIVGYKYGSLVPGKTISFTEAEYSEGYNLGKPCLVYLRDENVPVLPAYIERDPQKLQPLERFRALLKERHTVATFTDANDLAVKVAADLRRELFKSNRRHALTNQPRKIRQPALLNLPTWAYVAMAASLLVASLLVAPLLSKVTIKKEEPDPGLEVQVDRAKVHLDLMSGWKQLAEEERRGVTALSKAALSVTLEVRKYKKDAELNHILGTTSTLPKPFRVESTHNVETKESDGRCTPNAFTYISSFDIKNEPSEVPFMLNYTIDYWNAHNNREGESQAYYVSEPTKLIIYKITFPRDKPYTSIKFRYGEGLNCSSQVFDYNNPNIQEGVDDITGAKTVTWTIQSPETRWFYQVIWTW